MKKEVSEAVENYLETILILSKKKPDLHAIDICDELGYSRPTVSVVVKQMKGNGLITVDELNHIALTEKGREIAESIYERHNIISEFFMAIGVSRDTALKDACKIEHDISNETFECIKKHIKNI
ncbi:MAG: metal-dependent transcriptional regulator [Ruminiclostridium sp.]|nr:metal-dependent transcriptional regulator [Ruminiclostridium sp.]MBQ8410361.1 metal-dependent transcriptional regulator [Ruminiclostridium sp.]